MKSLWGQKPPQQLLLYGALALVLYLGRADLIAVWGLIYVIIVYRNWKKGPSCELWVAPYLIPKVSLWNKELGSTQMPNTLSTSSRDVLSAYV